MSQDKIDAVLKSQPGKWWTVNELSEHVNVNHNNLAANLKRMRDHDEVKYMLSGRRGPYSYKYQE